ncbi:MAG: 3-deoxy-7-phosphoheptulonate synthase, partial [Stenotrophobium sp.]
SGLSCPVGFKNGTDGSVKVAVDAVQAARNPHHFLSLTDNGEISIFETTGNPDSHIILRGGSHGTNYDAGAVDAACAALTKSGLQPKVMIDFSHANSSKQHKRQIVVGHDVGSQVAGGDARIIGVMIESNLVEGRQEIGPRDKMTYGQSVTDACIHWDDSAELLRNLAATVAQRRAGLAKRA